MNNKDILKAIENKQYLCLEDPIDGSEFLDTNERILNTYICTGDGDVDKIKRYMFNEEDNTIRFENSNCFVQFDPSSQFVVLKRIYNLPDDIVETMKEKHKMTSEERLAMCSIYTVNIVNHSDITPKLFAGKFPYYYFNTEFVNGTYVTNVKALYNDNIIIPRLLYISENDDYQKSVLDVLNFVNICMESDNMRYLLSGDYLRMQDAVLCLEDIDNAGYIFRNVIRNRYKTFAISYKNILNIVSNNRCISKEYICEARTKGNNPLFETFFGSTEYTKDMLIASYKSVLNKAKVEDSPICIIDEDYEAVFNSIKEIEDMKTENEE